MSKKTGRIDPGLILDAVWKRWRLLLIPMVVGPILAVAVREFVGPRYKTGSLVLVQEGVVVNPVLKDFIPEMQIKNRLPEISSLVRSPQTVERVLREMGMVDDAMPRQKVIDNVEFFRRRIQVFSEGGGLVRISMTGSDAGEVYRGVKLVTTALIDEMTRPQQDALRESVKFLRDRTRAIRDRIADLEQQERRVVRDNPNYVPEVREQKLDALKQLRTSLQEAESDLLAAREALQLAGGPEAVPNPDFARNTQALSAARRHLTELRATLTDAHPSVQAAIADVKRLESVRRRLQAAGPTTTVVEGRPDAELKVKHRQAEAQVAYLQARVDEHVEDVQSFADYEQAIQRLRRDLEEEQAEYGRLQERLRQAQLRLDLLRREQANEIRVVEDVIWPQVSPRFRLRFVAFGGLFGGLFFGLSLVFGLEFLDRTVRTPGESESLTGVPVLGTMPG